MAPRRNNGHTAMDVQCLLGLDPDCLDNPQTTNHENNNNSNNNNNILSAIVSCCAPNGDCLKTNTMDFGLITVDDLHDCVRVICNNENCTSGQYMHRECFDSWEQTVLSYLKSIGRARSWSEKQRQQNLWTKKGYDLVFKACGCKCNRGHLRKDLDWVPPTNNNIFGKFDEESTKKKKKRNRNNQKPVLAISTNLNSYHPNANMGLTMTTNEQSRGRAGSLSSENDGSSSPPDSAGSSEQSISPVHNGVIPKKPKSKTEIYSERVR